MAKPVLVVVHHDRETLAALERDLSRRFGADYQVLAADTPAAALAALGARSRAGAQAAVLLADQGLQGMTGIQFLSRAHELYPAAKRVLLIPYGDVAAGTAGAAGDGPWPAGPLAQHALRATRVVVVLDGLRAAQPMDQSDRQGWGPAGMGPSCGPALVAALP